jgi:hypothetical protein
LCRNSSLGDVIAGLIVTTKLEVFAQLTFGPLTRREKGAVAKLRSASIRLVLTLPFALLLFVSSLRTVLLRPDGFEHLSYFTLCVLPIVISYTQVSLGLWLVPNLAVRYSKGNVPFIYTTLIVIFLTVIPEAMALLSLMPPNYFASHSYAVTLCGIVLSESVIAFGVTVLFLVYIEQQFQEIIDSHGLNCSVFHPRHTKSEVDNASSRALQDMLSANVRGRIIHIVADNKYVVVTTENGDQLLSLSLTAAIERIEPESGLRVHRSAWVSWASMDRLVYENGNPRLILTTGDVFPVSRKNAPVLKKRLGTRT